MKGGKKGCERKACSKFLYFVLGFSIVFWWSCKGYLCFGGVVKAFYGLYEHHARVFLG